MKTDVLIIGGGVIGCAIAYELAKYKLEVALVEKNHYIADGTSKANSGMAHNGMGEKPGRLRSHYVMRGTKLMKDLCEQLYVPFQYRVGSVTFGFSEEERHMMEYVQKDAITLGIHDSEIVFGDKMWDLEPNVSRDAKYALYNPGMSIVGPYEYTIALGESAALNGVKFFLNHPVTGIDCADGKILSVHTSQGDFEPQVVINCAGLYADKIAAMVEEIDFEIKPRKGEYFLYDKKMGTCVKHVVSNLGDKYSKGMLIAPTVHGNIIAGSSATFIEEKDDFATHGEMLDGIHEHFIAKLVPMLPRYGEVIANFAGNRAVASSEDYIIGHARTVNSFINFAGMQSPALASSPAIAQDAVELVRECGLKLTEKLDYKPFRPKPVVLSELSQGEINKLVAQNPDYGEIICRCETISRGEILDAIHSPIPCTTVDAIKRHARAGMGRCQGGFCGPRVMTILAEELGTDMCKICKGNCGSNMVTGRTKEQ